MNPFAHASTARYAPCRAPGCAACFYDAFMREARGALVMRRIRLERAARRGASGIAYRGSNYRRALERACRDKASALNGAGGRGSVTRASERTVHSGQ